MKNIRTNTRRAASIRVGLLAWALTVAAGANAASSFPDYPLQTGTSSVAPNIMFILDDSGSMAFTYMPDDQPTTNPRFLWHFTPVHNKIWYNPGVTYKPWMKADGSRHTGGQSIDAVYSSTTRRSGSQSIVTGVDAISVMTDGEVDHAIVLLPKQDATNLNDVSSYYLYSVRNVAGAYRVVRSEYGPVSTLAEGVEGAGCTAPAGATNYWRNCTFATPTGRAEADEITNFATWYSYARTRAKVAKGGASEAFGTLGENFRIGYDSIWNRLGTTAEQNTSDVTTDATPRYPIPVGTDDGLFRGSNRSTWFSHLQNANALSGTPLHGALQRAGRYYQGSAADGPWGPQAGSAQLACRQAYTILTTDGYWNSTAGYNDALWEQNGDAKNSDGTAGPQISAPGGDQPYQYAPSRPYSDTYGETLADLAMHYWKRDLRTDLENRVPTSSANPAFWQHMVTFGISIGLQGTLDPENDVALIAAGDKSWPNPFQRPGETSTGWNRESARRIDDLLHMSVNGRGRFVAASNPDAFTRALKESLAAIQRRRASGSNVTSNGPTLTVNSHIYQATYTSGEWSGDLTAISYAGAQISSDPAWSMTAYALEDEARPFETRGVHTWNGSDGASFPTEAQVGLLARSGGNAPVNGVNNAAYIKGVRTGEKQNGGTLRDRTSPIGDIVNSSPFYAAQTNTLYVGANDGMLHAVDANNGKTLFSYVPAGIDFAALATLSHPDYQHRFFVDGGIDVTNTTHGRGSNILVASLGRGGKGVFALNVTAPNAFVAADHVLWDKTGAPDTDHTTHMGYVLGAPVVRKSNSGRTIAIVGNGIESSSGEAVLFVYEMNQDGSLYATRLLRTGATGSNGLSEPRAADTDSDGDVDFVYAGDLQGNLWKFNFQGTDSANWGVAITSGGVKKPLFAATDAVSNGNRQPITGAPAIAREPGTGRLFILFGTGRYISSGDIATTSTQTFYGLIDQTTQITSLDDLQQRSIAHVGTDSEGRAARSFQAYSALPTGKKGWYINLGTPTAGERVVTSPTVEGRGVWFPSIIPTLGTGCDSDGSGYINAVDAFTGTNPQKGGRSYSLIDTNRNGRGDDKLTGDSFGVQDGFQSSFKSSTGMPGKLSFVGNNGCNGGSNAKLECTPTPPGGDDPRRLGWRELFKRD